MLINPATAIAGRCKCISWALVYEEVIVFDLLYGRLTRECSVSICKAECRRDQQADAFIFQIHKYLLHWKTRYVRLSSLTASNSYHLSMTHLKALSGEWPFWLAKKEEKKIDMKCRYNRMMWSNLVVCIYKWTFACFCVHLSLMRS